MSQIRFLVSPGRRLLLFCLTFVIGFIVSAVVLAVLTGIGGEERQLAMMRIATIVQDIFMFILPAIITALIVTRQPVKLLCLAKAPSGQMTVLAIMVLLVSSPLMTWIINLNANIHLPESMARLEASLRAMEDSAGAAVDFMLGPHTLGNLLISVLIVGVMAGFSEEIFFRAGLLRLFTTARVRPWVAIWLTAFIFSALHMQFFGFVPRMLLGAFFGYLMVWSGSVWLPMLMHILNNSMYVVLQYTTGSGEASLGGAESSWYAITLSAMLTAAGLYLLYRQRITDTSLPNTTNQA